MISIIVPIYNAEKYLHACLDSLLCQTVQDLQIILVNDGSTDNSAAIEKEYAAKDCRIEVYQQTHAGQSAARNNGLKHAKGEFIAFVDADDTIAPDWCEQHLSAIESAAYVQSGYQRNSKHFLPKHRYQFTSPCMRLYRKETINGMRFTEGMIYEDVIWSADLWLSGASCRMINYAGYVYRQNPNSTTSRPHLDAQRKVLHELKIHAKGASFKGKLIAGYTIIRLKLYFIFR